MSKTWGFFFGGSGHGSEPSCQISAYYKLFSGFRVFCRISTRLLDQQKFKKKFPVGLIKLHKSR